MILTKTYCEPPFSKEEILRYACCRNADGEILSLVESCIKEVKDKLTYKVCYKEFNVAVNGHVCDFGDFQIRSSDLATNLKGANRVVIFAATVGVEIDRLIAKYSRIAPSKAFILGALGAERAEALCDAFCKELSSDSKVLTKPRFSPGYGDLPLESQRKIFAVLCPEKSIGLYLNDSLLMSPSKSVTAIVGICDAQES